MSHTFRLHACCLALAPARSAAGAADLPERFSFAERDQLGMTRVRFLPAGLDVEGW